MKHKLTIIGLSLAFVVLFANNILSAPCSSAGSIVRVKNINTTNYEYVEFKLKRPLNSGYSYGVTTVSPPFIEDPSGNTVVVSGKKFKKIKFNSITWTCTITQNISLPNIAIKGIKKLSQFEGIVEYVIGYRKTSSYISTTWWNSGSYRIVRMKFKK